jgi:hypothetical protein
MVMPEKNRVSTWLIALPDQDNKSLKQKDDIS